MFSLADPPATLLAVEALTVTAGWQDRCDRVFLWGVGGGGARHPRDIPKTAEICCDTVCATPCSARQLSQQWCDTKRQRILWLWLVGVVTGSSVQLLPSRYLRKAPSSQVKRPQSQATSHHSNLQFTAPRGKVLPQRTPKGGGGNGKPHGDPLLTTISDPPHLGTVSPESLRNPQSFPQVTSSDGGSPHMDSNGLGFAFRYVLPSPLALPSSLSWRCWGHKVLLKFPIKRFSGKYCHNNLLSGATLTQRDQQDMFSVF